MRITLQDINRFKTDNKKIIMITAYDEFSARVSDAAGIPLLLVGDMLGVRVQGHDSPIPVTMEQMLYHSEIVARVTERAFVIGDMPFMSYNTPDQALNNAGRFMQEAGVSCVKLEGGEYIAPVIAHIVKNGIPVMAHIGHSLQNVVQGNADQPQEHIISHAQQLLADAKAVQDAGAFAVVLKMVPMQLATIITENLHIPTIGMGSGPACDGQVQIFHDLLGLSPLRKHAKQYINVGEMAKTALMQFVDDIQTEAFPTDENSLVLDEAELKILRANGIFEW